MLASLQRRIVLALTLTCATWSFTFAWRDDLWLALIIYPAVAGLYALVLGSEFVAVYLLKDNAEGKTASALQLTGAWWAELMLAPKIFCWRQPFRSYLELDTVGPMAVGRTGVVLVHGFLCNRGFWAPWLRKLQALGVPAIAVNLEPLFGSIDDQVQIIESAVVRMEAATGTRVLLVGHSMGGLAIRAWLRHSDADARVRRVVTIATPHLGTLLATHSWTVNGRQMKVGSPWLRQLFEDEPANRFRLFTCCFSLCDNVVFPARRAILPGASELLVAGAAHVQLAFEPAVFEEACRWLDIDVHADVATTLRN